MPTTVTTLSRALFAKQDVLRHAAVLMITLVVLAANTAQAEDGYEALFDGSSLTGWQGDEELWSVEDGVIVGSTESKTISKNSFLSTLKSYDNFVLRLKFKLPSGNSGVQYRSKQYPEHVVRGYQADIADNMYMGILYEEGGRGILVNVDPAEVAKHNRPGEWNEYVITARDGHLTQQLNGFTTVDYQETSDEGATSGIIALQLHVGPPMKVYFKDIEIKSLD